MKTKLFLLVLFCVIAWNANAQSSKDIKSGGVTLTQAGIMARHFVEKNIGSCDFDLFPNFVGEATPVSGRFKVLEKFTKGGIEYVYRIYIQYYGGDWAEITNWDYGQLIVERTSNRKQRIFHGTMKQRDKKSKQYRY